MQVNMLEAKTKLSKLVQMVEDGEEESITIARNGKPVARIVRFDDRPRNPRIGVAKGKIAPIDWDAFDAMDAEVAQLFVEAGQSLVDV